MRAKVTTAFHGMKIEEGKDPESWFWNVGDELTTVPAPQAVDEGLCEWIDEPTPEESAWASSLEYQPQPLQPVIFVPQI